MSKQKKYRSRDYHSYLETLKALPTLQAKWEYTWDNWYALIVGMALLIFFIITMAVSIYNNSAPVYLNGEFVNIVSSDQAEQYQEDYLEQAFLRDYLAIPEDDRTVITYSKNLLLDFGDDTEAATTNYNTINQINVHMAAHEVDYFLMTDNVIDILNEHYEAFLDLREFLTEEEMVLYGDRLRYTQENVPIAIDVSDSKILANMNMVADAPVCFSWFAYVEDVDHMRPFFEFLMSTLS